MVKDDLRLLLALATQAERRLDAVHALDWIERALVVAGADPQSPISLMARLHYRRGTHLDTLNMQLEAVDAYRECLRQEPDHFYANHDLALILTFNLGRAEEARKYAQAALDRMPLVIEQINPAVRGAMRSRLTSIVESKPLMGALPAIPDDADK